MVGNSLIVSLWYQFSTLPHPESVIVVSHLVYQFKIIQVDSHVQWYQKPIRDPFHNFLTFIRLRFLLITRFSISQIIFVCAKLTEIQTKIVVTFICSSYYCNIGIKLDQWSIDLTKIWKPHKSDLLVTLWPSTALFRVLLIL